MNIFKENKSVTALPLIVSMMADYLSTEEEKSNSPLMSIEGIRNTYNRLLNLGLKNSANAKELKSVIDSQETYNNNVIKAQKLIDYIKKVNTVLDKNSYLISFEQFEVVCKKYDLVYNLLENYTGVIPEENILQLEKILSKIYEIPNINENLYFVDKAIVEDSDEGRKFGNWLENRRILYLPSKPKLKHDDCYWWRDIAADYPDCPKVKYDALNTISLTKLESQKLLIAAPAASFKDDFKITIRPKDPIVFQICPYGCLIHSVWGEEADDEVLAKYRKTLNL